MCWESPNDLVRPSAPGVYPPRVEAAFDNAIEVAGLAPDAPDETLRGYLLQALFAKLLMRIGREFPKEDVHRLLLSAAANFEVKRK
jgi:hypothetical protein